MSFRLVALAASSCRSEASKLYLPSPADLRFLLRNSSAFVSPISDFMNKGVVQWQRSTISEDFGNAV